jgi:hypothetical protein
MKRKILYAAAIVLAPYFLSYIILSALGRYEPSAIGLAGVKWYRWSPKGFTRDYRPNMFLHNFYFPLHQLDNLIWHEGCQWGNDKYPFNEVPPERIGEVYEAWSEP